MLIYVKNTNKLKRIQTATLLFRVALNRRTMPAIGTKIEALIPKSKLVAIIDPVHILMAQHPNKSSKMLKNIVVPILFFVK